MKKSVFFLLLLLLFACKEDKDDIINIPVSKNIEIEDFVYQAMNYVYYWQEDVPDLADNRFGNDKEYIEFLQSFDDPEDLFNNLKFESDRFSYITDNYVELENQLNSISTSNGMRFGLARFSATDNTIFGYVRYVLPDTDAAQKGIKRGDAFAYVNQTPLTVDNYADLLLSNKPSYTIDLATISNGQIQPTGTSVTLNNSELEEKELHISKVIPHEGKKWDM